MAKAGGVSVLLWHLLMFIDFSMAERRNKRCVTSFLYTQAHTCTVLEFFFGGVKKAYMPIDANHVSNPKDRYSKSQESFGSMLDNLVACRAC